MPYDSPNKRYSKQKLVTVVCGLALLTLAANLLTPRELEASELYALSIAASAWLRSLRFLWLTTGIGCLFVFMDLSYGAAAIHLDEPHWPILLHRFYDGFGLVMVAIVAQLWIRSLNVLEESRLLLEKEIDLSRELQHRVRNDLHVIYIFLISQARQTRDPDASRSLQIVERLVMSLGQIYDHLVGAGMPETIDFAAHLKRLCSEVGEFRAVQRPGVELICRANDSVFLDHSTTTALGIVVNELIANSYEHGFPDREGKIEVGLLYKETEGQAVLRIDDNGIGLAESAADSVGLDLVRRWVKRVNGTIEVRVDAGTKWSIVLPVPSHPRDARASSRLSAGAPLPE